MISALYFFSKAQNLDQRALSHPIRDAFFPLGFDDEIVFSAQLALISFQQANFLKQTPSTEAYAQKLKAIKGVNKRLNDPTGEGISDSTIFSIMAMSRIETGYTLQTHVQAIQRMIAMRGGFSALGERFQLVLAW